MTQEHLSQCAVCSESDRRALVHVIVDRGDAVVLCGSHAVMMRRIAPKGGSVAELRALLADRRAPRARRLDEGVGEALAAALQAGFAGERRGGEDRRAPASV